MISDLGSAGIACAAAAAKVIPAPLGAVAVATVCVGAAGRSGVEKQTTKEIANVATIPVTHVR